MSAKQGTHQWHRCENINIVAKCIVHMHITAEVKACWLSCYALYFKIVEKIVCIWLIEKLSISSVITNCLSILGPAVAEFIGIISGCVPVDVCLSASDLLGCC